MHAKADKDGQLHIVVANYHDGEYPFSKTVDAMDRAKPFVYYAWDNGRYDLLESLGGDTKGGPDLSMAQLDVFHRYLHKELNRYEIWPSTDMDLVGQYIYVVSGSVERILNAIIEYGSMLQTDVAQGGPGADDGTYDYFPGAVEALRQLVEGLIELDLPVQGLVSSAKAVYNSTVETARLTHYKDNEEADDLLPYIE